VEENYALSCKEHTIVSHLAVLHHSSALLVKYDDWSEYDNQPGWFLPNDGLKHVEHPETGAKRILREQLGFENATLRLVDVESFIGDNRSWHLIFDFLAFPTSMRVSRGKGVAEAKWFEIDKLPGPGEFAHNGWGRAVLLKHARVQEAKPLSAL
jgi:ADP-ribose pyrophosphatase YjhB (NUDIX family)